MSDIYERLEEEILHAFRKSFDSQQSGINANFLMDIQREIERLRADLGAVKEERDALLAHLAPVDDDILREIAAMHFARSDGHSDNWDRYVDEAKDYIDAIRPHIEAVERERCAKIAEGSFLFDIETWLNSTKKEMTTHVAKAIAAAIRSGK